MCIRDRRYHRLDVLVNNAGGYFARRQETAEGREMTWALNLSLIHISEPTRPY